MQTTYVRPASESRSEVNGLDTDVLPAPARSRQGGNGLARQKSSGYRARSGNGSANSDRSLIEALSSSKVFQEYERAFTEATGMPVALRPVETWQLPHHGKRNEGPFCSIVSEKSR